MEKPSEPSPDDNTVLAKTSTLQPQDDTTNNNNNPPLSKTKSRTEAALHRISTHLTTHSIKDPGPPPDGGLLAWTQVFCASLAIMNTWGFINSFGAFQTYYATILAEPNSTISWIGSIQAWLLFFVGMFSGRALDAGWFRPTVALGIALQIIGIFSMSWARTFWQLLLTQGLCVGLGGGIFFTPVMGLVSTYFSAHRGVAIGIVTSGNAVGGVVYPVVVRQLLGKIGFGWTVRVLGFLNVASLAVVLGFMKPRLPPRKAGPLIDWDAFHDMPYCIYVVGVCCLMPPVYCVFYYIASFATDQLGMTYTNSLNMVIILNGVGIPARVLPGFIADRYLGVLNMLILCLFITSIILWTWLSVSSIPAYYVWTVMYGVFCAAFQSLFATVIAALSNDIMKTGTRLGMALMVIGFAALTGGPISGALLSAADGDYRAPIAWASASTTFGFVFCVWARGKKHGWKVMVKC